MTTDTLHSSITKMDHLDEKHDSYLYSPLTSYIYTHAEKHMETFFRLRKYYTMNLGRDGVSYEVAERILKKLSKQHQNVLYYRSFLTVNEFYFLQNPF